MIPNSYSRKPINLRAEDSSVDIRCCTSLLLSPSKRAIMALLLSKWKRPALGKEANHHIVYKRLASMMY